MRSTLTTIALTAALLTGCVSHDGTYAPSCTAFAGSEITLSDGSFVWEKFTDEVVVNDDGEAVDRFPGYPLRGSYRINGQTVRMTTGDGSAMDNMYLHRHEGNWYLYTAEQFEQWQATEAHDDCALVLSKGSAARE